MKECVNSRCKLNESTEVCHARYLSCNNFSYREILSCVHPRICLRELKAERDLRVMDIFYEYFQLIAYMEELLRIVNSSPGHLRDVEQSVNTAQINKSTEICHILHSSFYCVANLQLSKELFLLLSALSNKKLSSVTDHTISSRVKFADHELDLFSFIFAEILLVRI